MKRKIRPLAALLGAVIAAGVMTSCGKTIDKYAPLPEDEDVPEFSFGGDKIINKGEPSAPLMWQKLENIDTHPEFRALMESAFGIEQTEEGKSGCLYLGSDGVMTGENTLLNALSNADVKNCLRDKDIMTALYTALCSDYSDLTKSDATAAVLNAYFDILPDDGSGTFGGGEPLSRAQAMTLVMRAVTPTDGSGKPASDAAFTEAVGDSAYTDYAAPMNALSFVSTADGSLTDSVFGEQMTRAEYIYLMMNAVFGADEISSFDPYDVYLADCIDGGESDGTNGYLLTVAMANPEAGLPTPLFKALAKAVSIGVIDAETKWSEPITKKDALFLFAKAGYKREIKTETVEEKTEKKDKTNKKSKKKNKKKKTETAEG